MEFFYSKSRYTITEGPILAVDNNWRRYLSAFWSEYIILDGNTFVSIEMAFHYEKFKRTNHPEIGEIYFKGGPFDLFINQGRGKVYSGKASMKKLKCVLDVEKWTGESVEVMKKLVQLRFATDAHFRAIIIDAKEKDVPLLHFERGTLKRPPFWGCFRLNGTGELVGQNMYGKILMSMV
jgi:predicted NAD-dependent protein-ADP-ribosyltransferase YbiA (DUF1768 family)